MDLSPTTSLALMQVKQDQNASALEEKKKALAETSDKEEQRLGVVAKDFEAMFIAEMMKPMFEQIKPDALFGGGKGEEIFQGFMLQEYGKMVAESGQLGIAESIKGELIRMQSEADKGPLR